MSLLGVGYVKWHAYHSPILNGGGGGKARKQSDRVGWVGDFFIFVYQKGLFCTLNVIIMGRLCEVAFIPITYSPVSFCVLSDQRVGGMYDKNRIRDNCILKPLILKRQAILALLYLNPFHILQNILFRILQSML